MDYRINEHKAVEKKLVSIDVELSYENGELQNGTDSISAQDIHDQLELEKMELEEAVDKVVEEEESEGYQP